MASKINIPSVMSLETDNLPYGVVVYLQAVRDALTLIDKNVVYKDDISVQIPPPTIRAKSAQGVSFVADNVNVASGDDYAVLVQDFQRLLQAYLDLHGKVTELTAQVKGS